MVSIYHSTARSRTLKKIDEAKAGSWVHVVEPSEDELEFLASEFKLEKNIIKDSTDIYEAPRVETQGDTTYVFTRYCHPEGQAIATEPLLIIYTSNNIITIERITHAVLDKLISGQIEVITTQKTKTFLQILDQIGQSYKNKLTAISRHILKIRWEMRHTEISTKDFLGFIELEEDLNEFISALQPQALVINALMSGKYMKLYEDDRNLVEDINLGTSELIEQTKSKLRTVTNLRQAYEAIATNNLNRAFRHLTSIAIFLAIPTTIGGLYGMNVLVPMQENPDAFWIIMSITLVLVAVSMYVFNKKRWI